MTLVSDQVLQPSQVMNQNVKSGDRKQESTSAGEGGWSHKSQPSHGRSWFGTVPLLMQRASFLAQNIDRVVSHVKGQLAFDTAIGRVDTLGQVYLSS